MTVKDDHLVVHEKPLSRMTDYELCLELRRKVDELAVFEYTARNKHCVTDVGEGENLRERIKAIRAQIFWRGVKMDGWDTTGETDSLIRDKEAP